MDTNCNDDNVDRGDQKGGIQGGAHRTAVYLGERCRYDHPSRPVDTPPERVSRNTLVELGVECAVRHDRRRQPLKSFRSPTRRPEIVLQQVYVVIKLKCFDDVGHVRDNGTYVTSLLFDLLGDAAVSNSHHY